MIIARLAQAIFLLAYRHTHTNWCRFEIFFTNKMKLVEINNKSRLNLTLRRCKWFFLQARSCHKNWACFQISNQSDKNICTCSELSSFIRNAPTWSAASDTSAPIDRIGHRSSKARCIYYLNLITGDQSLYYTLSIYCSHHTLPDRHLFRVDRSRDSANALYRFINYRLRFAQMHLHLFTVVIAA